MSDKPKSYGQFDQGPGQKYAPKPPPRKTKPAEPFAEAAPPRGPSEEDSMRKTLMDERKLQHHRNPRAQSTDHMN